jgi:4-amino-4-deoxy-L-arabinose transferase-like glycosyltransferase
MILSNAVPIVVFMIALLLRLAFLGYKSVWFDEAYSVFVGKMGLMQLIAYTGQHDNYPPLYYLILHFWPLNEYNEFSLRLPSALFGAATVFPSYWLGKEVFNKKTGVIVALLIAISPYNIYFSQEARAYSLLCLAVASSYFFLFRALDNDSKINWFGYAASTLVALYTHYFAFLALLTQIIYVLYLRVEGTGRLLNYSKTLVAMVILYLPWIPFASSLTSLGASTGLVGPRFNVYDILILFNRFTLFGIIEPTIHAAVLVVFAALVLFAFFLIARKFEGKSVGLLSSFLALPMVILLGFAGVNVWETNYFIYLLPLYLALVAFAISRAKRKFVAPLLLLFICTASLIAVYPTYFQSAEDWRSAATFVETNYKQGDLVVFDPSYYRIAFNYYFKGSYENLTQNPGWTRVWLVTPLPPSKSSMKLQFDSLYNQIGSGYFMNVNVFLYLRGNQNGQSTLIGASSPTVTPAICSDVRSTSRFLTDRALLSCRSVGVIALSSC